MFSTGGAEGVCFPDILRTRFQTFDIGVWHVRVLKKERKDARRASFKVFSRSSPGLFIGHPVEVGFVTFVKTKGPPSFR